MNKNIAMASAATEPPLGAHLVTPRRAYLHHGIYVGKGRVVHYSGLAHGLRRGPVEEVSLAKFSRNHPIWVKTDVHTQFSSQEIVRRARSRLGEDSYRLLTNNCKHFCDWCLRGQERSREVKTWLPGIQRPRLVMTNLGAQVSSIFFGRALIC